MPMYSPPDTDDKVDLSLCRDVEIARCARRPLQTNLFPLLCKVLLDIRLRTLEDDLALGLRRLDCPSQSILLEEYRIMRDQSRKMV